MWKALASHFPVLILTKLMYCIPHIARMNRSTLVQPGGASWLSRSVRDLLQARDRGFDPGWADLCPHVVLLGKALCSHVHSLDPGVNGYLVGQ